MVVNKNASWEISLTSGPYLPRVNAMLKPIQSVEKVICRHDLFHLLSNWGNILHLHATLILLTRTQR